MAQKLMTPGVYIEEKNAFPGSVVEVETAIPAFIGYTQTASRNGKSLVNQPTRVTSFAEYRNLFGGAFVPTFTLDSEVKDGNIENEVTINGKTQFINYKTNHIAFMFPGIKFFFDNGGGTCYIVSVGTYEKKGDVVDVKKEALETGIKTLLKEQEPTMIVIPDAIRLGDDGYDVYKKALAHCAKMQSRVAILDIHDGYGARVLNSVDVVKKFREKIGTENLSYAAAYYPWLNTNIVQKGDVTFENLNVKLEDLLPDDEKDAHELIKSYTALQAILLEKMIEEKPEELEESLAKDNQIDLKNKPKKIALNEPEEPDPLGDNPSQEEKDAHKNETEAYKKVKKEYDDALKNYETDKKKFDESKKKITSKLEELLKGDTLKETKKLLSAYKANKNRNFHLGLVATSPTYVNLLEEVRTVMNLQPASSAMAGVYTSVDNNRGVWKSPANISLNSVIKPSANITHDEQENLNVDATSGKSINAIRTFPGIGTLVWGARTLDGNSLDWKYINVRRTMIMLEQSIKLALQSYVFEPNDANTWVTVKSMIYNFLNEKWKQGALAGASPDDAFDVQVGLGNTMTSLDILEGKMLVSVKLAIVRPAEFIVVTFEQQMQKS